MKIKLTLAFFFLFIGISSIVDWFIFSSKNDELKRTNYKIFIDKYIGRFPSFLQPLFPRAIAGIFAVLLLISAIIFISTKKKGYSVVGVISFLLAFWYLFSLM